MTESTVEERKIANEPRLIREMRMEAEIAAEFRKINSGPDGAAWAQRCISRAEADRRRTQDVVRLILPEIMRMQIQSAHEEHRRIVAKLARQKEAQQ